MGGLLVFVMLVLLLDSRCRGDHLFFSGAHPESHLLGLWGGQVDRQELEGNKTDLYAGGYNCAIWNDATGTEHLRVLDVISTSYNRYSRDVLLQLDTEYTPERRAVPWERITLAAGPLCLGTVSCSRPISLMLWNALSRNGEAGPFAWNNQELFFILKHRYTGDVGNRTVIELRHSETCQDIFPFRSGNFDFSGCSRLVAEIYNSTEDVSTSETLYDVTPGHQLLFVSAAHGWHLFVVLFKIPQDMGLAKEAMLVEVAMEGKDHLESTVYIRHRAPLSLPFPQGWSPRLVRNSGGLDFLENRLCWSSLEQVWCAWWVPDTFEDIRQHVNSSQLQDICTLDHGHEEAWITGVALATTYHPFNPGNLTLYGACQSSGNSSVGGAFLYHYTTGGYDYISQLKSSDIPVKAASMFFATRPDDNCPTVVPPTDSPGGSGGGSGSVPGSDGNQCVLGKGTLILMLIIMILIGS